MFERLTATLLAVLLAAGGALAQEKDAKKPDATSATTAPEPPKPVRIGFSTSKTGLFAPVSAAHRNAYLLWRDMVNARGGLEIAGGERRKVELLERDDRSEPTAAAKIYHGFIYREKVDLVLSPQGEFRLRAVAPVVARAKYPLLATASTIVDAKAVGMPGVFLVTPFSPDAVARELAGLITARGITRAAILSNRLRFPAQTAAATATLLERAGVAIVHRADYAPDIADLKPILAAAKGGAPEAVLVFSEPGDAILYLNQAPASGLNPKLQFLLEGPARDIFRKLYGPALNGIVTLGSWNPEEANGAGSAAFLEGYRKAFGADPDPVASVNAFVACQILEQAVARVGLDRRKLREAIGGMSFDTLVGPVSFEGNRNGTTPAGLISIETGGSRQVWPVAGGAGAVAVPEMTGSTGSTGNSAGE